MEKIKILYFILVSYIILIILHFLQVYKFLLVLPPCLFNLYAEYIMRNAGLEEAQAGINIAGRNINNLRYAGDTPLRQKVKRN